MVQIREETLRLGAGVALWAVSGLMTFNLFSTLAGPGLIYQLSAGVWAAGLEAGKALSWRRGRWWRLLSILLSGVTMLSVLLTTIDSIQDTRARAGESARLAVQSSVTYIHAVDDLRISKKLVENWSSRIERVPGEYTTGARELSQNLIQATARVEALEAKIENLEGKALSEGSRSPFDSLGSGWWIEVVIALGAFLLTEVTALGLMGRSKVAVEGTKEVSAETYLRVATKGMPEGKLRGRKEVAHVLQVSERQVRKARREALEKRPPPGTLRLWASPGARA